MIIDGKHSVREALIAGKEISKIVIQKDSSDKELKYIASLARERDIKVLFLDKPALDRESPSSRHQGVIAYVDDFKYAELEDIYKLAEDKGEPLFVLILDGIQDTHNLGSVIRVAECAGVHGIIIPERRAAQVNETVIRISAGAVEHMLIARVRNINDTILELKDRYVKVLCADMDGESIYDTNLKGDVAIVVGGEDSGVGRLTRDRSDGIIALPLKGKVNSLNASVACGIVTYEVLRQRMSR